MTEFMTIPTTSGGDAKDLISAIYFLSSLLIAS